MSATAFPSGVMTMPAEATEQTGPIVIWRKELRPDSGGAGEYRGGLGQYMEIGARKGHEFDISAMFDRVNHPARGRRGGAEGGPTSIAQDDGTQMRQGPPARPAWPQGDALPPGGAGYGAPADRDPVLVRRDLAHGYISAEIARDYFGLSENEIEDVQKRASLGELF